jgi:Zn-dependent protease/predicted transcriptional regulator
MKIEFYLDFSWFLIAAFATYSLTTQIFPPWVPHLSPAVYLAMGLAAAGLFFFSILLHELGHSIVSQRCGIPVPRITLLLIGGLAEISREPDDARTELKIAVGGPIVSLVLAALYFGVSVISAALGFAPVTAVCQWLAVTNLVLVLFNLIPGYPLDGGRILRALLWARSGKLRRATYVATRIGVAFSYVLVLVGLWAVMQRQFGGLVYLFIALFLKSAAESGYTNTVQRAVLTGVTVREIMTPSPITIPAFMPLSRVVDEFFLANHHVAFPVVDDDGTLHGLIRLDYLKQVPREKWPYISAGDLVAECDTAQLSISVATTASRAMRQLLAAESGRLAVVEEKRVVGIVTRHDILQFIEIHAELEEI